MIFFYVLLGAVVIFFVGFFTGIVFRDLENCEGMKSSGDEPVSLE